MSSTLGKRKDREGDVGESSTHGSTLFVSNLPYTATSTDLQTLFSDIAPVRSAFVVSEKGTGVSKGVGYVSFAIKEDAQSAFETISSDGIVLDSRKLRVQWADTKPKEGEALKREPKSRPPPRTSTATIKASGTPNRASRLIVRNLPFDITEQDLRAIFLPYGPVHSIHIPTGDGKKAKGFAFVWMLSKKDAEKALDECNGMAVKAGMVEGMVTDKQKRKKLRREEKKRKVLKVEGQKEAEDGIDAIQERVIAVDWALSKEKWQEEQAKMEDADMKDEHGSSSVSEQDDSDAGENLGVHERASDSSEDESDGDEEGDGDQKPTKPTLPPPETGTTLFVRNVPFAATEDELRTLFRAFGPLRYARITLDPATGRSRGTGFTCFWNKSDADKVIEQSDLLRTETTAGGDIQPKKNPFTLPSILTPDPSSTMAQSLVLHGRTLDVTRAVTRDQAGKLKEDGEKRREKADKRNLYLLREGVILPSAPAAESLTPAEIERRTGSFNARRTLLRSNPSLYISKTRLSIRQIPIYVTERVLKRLAVHAVRAFESEVKKDLRVGLTEDELTEVVDQEEEEKDESSAVKEEEGRGEKNFKPARITGVKQVKIVRQHERVDPVTGKGRSKGYGFVEMLKHRDALRVLRWSNNNPDVGPLFDKWWKEELEDLIKKEKAKGMDEKDEARLKRMQDELEKSGSRQGKGTLIAEFSIENVQVVQRRSALQKDRASTTETRRPREKIAFSKPQTDEATHKKRRLSTGSTHAPVTRDRSSQPGGNIGSLIGRKRKERKSGKKGGG